MITKENFENAANEVKKNLFLGLPKMIEYKKNIQINVLEIASQNEMADVVACRINQSLIDKLVRLAHEKWIKEGDAISLYCAAMAIGTIIKEYEWGTYYITPNGLYELAKRIQNI